MNPQNTFSSMNKMEYLNFLATTPSPTHYSEVSVELRDDPYILKLVLDINSKDFMFASERLRNDYSSCLRAFKIRMASIDYMGEDILNNKAFMWQVIRKKPSFYDKFSDNLKKDQDIIKYLLEDGWENLEQAPLSARSNKEQMLKQMQYCASNFEHVSAELKNDIDMARVVMSCFPHALSFASPEILANKSLMLEALTYEGTILEYMSDDLKNDTDIVEKAVSKNPLALEYASEELKTNPLIVLHAITKNGYALRHADRQFIKNRQYVELALLTSSEIFEYIDPVFQDDKALFHKLLNQNIKDNAKLIEFASETIKNDKQIVKKVLNENGYYYQFISNDLKENIRFVLCALKNNIYAFRDLPESFKKNKKLVLHFFQTHPHDKNDILSMLPELLTHEIARNDPVQYLKTAILQEKLNEQLGEKSKLQKKMKV